MFKNTCEYSVLLTSIISLNLIPPSCQYLAMNCHGRNKVWNDVFKNGGIEMSKVSKSETASKEHQGNLTTPPVVVFRWYT